MELGTASGSASLVAVADGTTSLYLSSGGGMLGGGAPEDALGAGAHPLSPLFFAVTRCSPGCA